MSFAEELKSITKENKFEHEIEPLIEQIKDECIKVANSGENKLIINKKHELKKAMDYFAYISNALSKEGLVVGWRCDYFSDGENDKIIISW